MLKIAITGGIGSGKSTVSSYLEEKGYRVVYADRIARELTAPGGDSISYIIENFGRDYIAADGSMDRAKMRELVIKDKAALKLLEKGTTDVVSQRINAIINDAENAGEKLIFFEIPLLFEKNAQDEYDSVWLVKADKTTRTDRVIMRDGISADEVIGIMSNQTDDEYKERLSDIVIINDGSIRDLKEKIDEILRILL